MGRWRPAEEVPSQLPYRATDLFGPATTQLGPTLLPSGESPTRHVGPERRETLVSARPALVRPHRRLRTFDFDKIWVQQVLVVARGLRCS